MKTTDREKLITEKCPFCGGDGRIKGYKKYMVICKTCSFCTAKFSTAAEAAAAWNKRTLLHCKDCNHYISETGWCKLHSRYLDTGDEYVMFRDNDYCSDAMAKTGGETDGSET